MERLKPCGKELVDIECTIKNLSNAYVRFKFIIFDNDTKLLFASTFDGDWHAYINGFAALIADPIALIFGEADGWLGIRNPNAKDWTAKHQVTSTYFYSAYPNASVIPPGKASSLFNLSRCGCAI